MCKGSLICLYLYFRIPFGYPYTKGIQIAETHDFAKIHIKMPQKYIMECRKNA